MILEDYEERYDGRPWICDDCGAVNPDEEEFCRGCGFTQDEVRERKDAHAEHEAETDGG